MAEEPHIDGVGEGAECRLCPICVLLQAVSATRPEVTGHLLAAGRELTSALKAALDGHEPEPQAGGPSDPADEGLRRIKID